MSETYKKTVKGTLGAGMSSLFGGVSNYYVLEHKVSSKYHKLGEAQEIIVDYAEIGRDRDCAVRFDESFNTVSRKHAAIVKKDDNWKLVQLSQTNSTFLNGHKVADEWYLQNGDEIQLSVNGPKIGFIIPQSTGKNTSMNLTHRLSLFRQQALRPYRTAVIVLGILLLLVIGGGVGYGMYLYNEATTAKKELVELQKQLLEQTNQLIDLSVKLDSAQNKIIESEAKLLEEEAKNAKTAEDLEKVRKKYNSLNKKVNEMIEENQRLEEQKRMEEERKLQENIDYINSY